jgi:5'-methylthioadenosine phosphorylase
MNTKIGIIGGSGFYDLAKGLKEIKVDTPYGPPSDKLALGKISGKEVVFLPRHSKNHSLPPHMINYKANIWALKNLGVSQVLTSNAAGSLQPDIKPGDLVILDQFIDRTRGRPDTFFNGPVSTHISSAYPYCPQLCKLGYQTSQQLKLNCHSKGTVVVIQGPRFSTAAESRWFTNMGGDVINMTQYPEVVLAREQEICFMAMAIVTDWDAGISSIKKIKPVSARQVTQRFKANINNVKKLIKTMIKNWPEKISCQCQQALKDARL